jgi:hypothetical protein
MSPYTVQAGDPGKVANDVIHYLSQRPDSAEAGGQEVCCCEFQSWSSRARNQSLKAEDE